ncbi:Holliday junction branch migration protein RuvA [Candidatus Nomurabacteria bacterium]|nr:MAG: Holliday junction branch migration protein RuvA [Candidatus Nomurabacteria bacterium]
MILAIYSFFLKNESLSYTGKMIARLEGSVIEASEKWVILDVAGVGYRIYCSPETLSIVTKKESIALYTYLSVREDALDLYGFISSEEHDFFEMLLSVSGIGPKSALGVLSATTIDTLKQAIGSGDTSYLTKVSGIGRKTAEKIVIELRDKLRAHVNVNDTPGMLRAESDVVEALKSLGYSQNEARDALKEIDSSISGTSARIKEALKILGKK